MEKKAPGIYKKLVKVLTIQLALISCVTLLSVYGAAKVVEDVLIKEALEGEARFFWQHYEEDPNFKLPSTLNLTGYFAKNSDMSLLPEELSIMPLGYQRLESKEKKPLVHVSEKFGHRLYLVFQEGQVSRLAFYFGVAPLAFVLLIIYLPAWITYMLSKRAISPVVKLSKIIEEAEINENSGFHLNFSEIEKNADAEVLTLLDAFEQYSFQVEQYLERENNFIRYASHELRTPLAVLKGSISLLSKHQLTESQQKVVLRMKPMVLEMEELLEALLLLTKNQLPKISDEALPINHLVEQIIHKVKTLFEDRSIEIIIEHQTQLKLALPERLLSICLNNIIMNAFNYTDHGSIKVTVMEDAISVTDTGKGIRPESLKRIFEPFFRAERDEHDIKGFGLGLSIVKKVCQQMKWDVAITSEHGKGTTVCLRFNKPSYKD